MDATAATAPSRRTLIPAPIPGPCRTSLFSTPAASEGTTAPEAPAQREKTRPMAAWTNPELMAAVAGKPLGSAMELPIWSRGVKNLAELSKDELMCVLGVSPVQAKRVQAAFEIHRRLNTADEQRPKLANPELLAAYMLPYVGLDHERMWMVAVDPHQRPLTRDPIQVSQGDVDGTDCNPRAILRHAISLGASGFFLVHNHPSEEHTPSPADRACTRNMATAARVVGIPLRDHLVMNRVGGFTSLRRSDPMLFVD